MDLTMEKRDVSSITGLKVGLLFNLPVRPPRGETVDYVAEVEVEEQVDAVEDALDRLGLEHQRFPLTEDVERLVKALKAYASDVVINLCEGAFGDSHLEMNVPAILELLRVPYTGSPPLALGLCQNKGLTKDVLRTRGIPTPDYQILNRFDEWTGGLDYPLFVKPLSEDASLGITRDCFVQDDVELKHRVEYVLSRYRQPALVEQYIAGRELNVALLGNTKPEVLPISEIVFTFSDEPKIVDYSAKWLRESDEYQKTIPTCPADLTSSTRNAVESWALQAYRALCCRDYARIDIRLKGTTPYVLEVNPNPDISPDAGFVRSLRAAGISYEAFIERLIHFALERHHVPL
jgi:D-alanine-D-alanine ligase